MLKKQKYKYIKKRAMFELKCNHCQKKILRNEFFYNSAYYKNLCEKCYNDNPPKT